MPGAVQDAVIAFADFLLKYFVVLSAVGALAMALIELAKKLFDWRTRFHIAAVTRWVRDAHKDGEHAHEAYAELLHLCTGVPLETAGETARDLLASRGRVQGTFGILWIRPRQEFSVFALELERMLGHFQDAVDLALNFPDRYRCLYTFATGGSDQEDRAFWLKQAPQPAGTAVSREDTKSRADTYARLHQVVKRKLDAFQLLAAHNWSTKMQMWANVLGILILLGALVRATPAGTSINWLEYATLSLFGGMLSPIAKDVVVALKKVRQSV